jgi:beta-ribofuranosylaminobenzene 5'-phosphate synthase
MLGKMTRFNSLVELVSMPGSKTPYRVSVTAMARLHMGFLDLHGGLQRRFGSIGLTLEEPVTELAVVRAADSRAAGTENTRAAEYACHFMEHVGLKGSVAIELGSRIPEHAGLGSGTQMALAVGWAVARLYGVTMTVREVAAVVERGARSGIGIGAFEQGGLLVDGGRGPNTLVPPLLARLEFPEDWRILLIFDNSDVGVHGAHEVEAFRTLPEFPEQTAADLCRRVLMQALPAVAERDLKAFGSAIYEIQCRIGDYFASAQGGERFTSATVGGMLEWLRQQGNGCVGQSSWGPTGFAVLENELEAQAMAAALKAKCAGMDHISFMVCKARNQGCEVRVAYEGDLADKACAVN